MEKNRELEEKKNFTMIERYDKLASIAQYIRQEQTGSLKEFAQKCEIKKDRLFDYIETLREFTGRDGTQILYDRIRNTYYFSPSGKFSDFKFIADD